MRVLDGFLVNDELDLLELRLSELDPIVDLFVAVQCDHSLRGEPKPLHLDIKDDRWATWREKLHVVNMKWHPEPHPGTEWTQRRLVGMELERLAQAGDLLMLSDVDEIPSRRIVSYFAEDPPKHPISLIMRLYYYRIDLRMGRPWIGTVIWPHGCSKEEVDAQELRTIRGGFPQIGNAGWHFSWLGDAKNVQNKLRHLDVPGDAAIFGGGLADIPVADDMEKISARVEAGVDLFARSDPQSILVQVPIEPGIGQPVEVESWLARFPAYS